MRQYPYQGTTANKNEIIQQYQLSEAAEEWYHMNQIGNWRYHHHAVLRLLRACLLVTFNQNQSIEAHAFARQVSETQEAIRNFRPL